MQTSTALLFSLVLVAGAMRRGDFGSRREGALLQTWGQQLDAGAATPVQRVVKLLQGMSETLQKEMDEDEDMYHKLGCWCNNNEYEKNGAITEEEAKIADLTSTVESLTARTAELKGEIQQLNEDVAANKAGLATATELREKELKAFHGLETDSVQNIENIKAAIVVLSKHYGSALPQLTFSLLAVHKGRDMPFAQRSLDVFMSQNGYSDTGNDASSLATQRFLQQHKEQQQPAAPASGSWRSEETATVQRALRSASAFMQAHQGEDYMPAYSASPQAGEIMGVLKQLKEQMESELSEAQKTETARAAAFASLRASKTLEIETTEKQAEKKEDQLAQGSMDLAEAKEDLEQTEAALSENQKFMMNLKATCADADSKFDERKQARLAEIKAVADTIGILTADNARDVIAKTYTLLQVSTVDQQKDRQTRAAAVLRKLGSPELAILATSVELDAFTRVKKAIDDMSAMLKVEQADEVKKNDWCKSSLQGNEMATAREEDNKADLNSKHEGLEATVQRLADEVATAQRQIAQLHVDLQSASENRVKENVDFQQTVADQRATVEVLHAALERLATFYDQADLAQTKATHSAGQTPPVQAEYKANSGSAGVMQMIEKLIFEAKEMEADARKGEVAAQGQYESVVANTFSSVHALQQAVATKTTEKAQATKEKLETESDLSGSVDELEGLTKTNAGLHSECDYLIKNFDARQEARSQEMEALQQAKQILSGADLA